MLWAIAAALAIGALQLRLTLSGQPLGMDFLPLWTAGRFAGSHPGQIYDFAAISHAQGWLLPDFNWLRPFANPPTALLLLAPFGALPFWPALAIWVGLGLGVFLLAGWRLSERHRVLALVLMGLSPATVMAALVGQSVLLAAALVVLAIVELERRPRAAGALLALAAAIKPQMALLAPVALIAGGGLEALVSAAVVEAVLVALSAIVFGPARWSEWLASLPAFQAVIDGTPGLAPGVISPAGGAHLLGLSGPAVALWRAVFAVVGVVIVWRGFAAAKAAPARLASLAVGTLLATPYAMHYDGVLMAPAAVVIAARDVEAPGWVMRLLALGFVCEAASPYIGFLCLLAYAGLTVWQSRSLPAPVTGPRLGLPGEAVG